MTSFNAFEHDGYNGFASVGFNARNGCQCVIFLYACGDSTAGASVWKLNPDLTVAWSYDIGTTCYRLAVDREGSVYVTHDENASSHIVTKLDSTGAFVYGITIHDGRDKPRAIDVHTDLSIRVYNSSRLYSYDPDGVRNWAVPTALLNAIWNPLAINSAGDTILCSYQASTSLGNQSQPVAIKYDSSGTVVGTATKPLPLIVYPKGIRLIGNDFECVGSYAASSNTVGPITNYDMLRYGSDLSFAGWEPYYSQMAVLGICVSDLCGPGQQRIYASASGSFRRNSQSLNFITSGPGPDRCVGVGAEKPDALMFCATHIANDVHTDSVSGELKNVFAHEPDIISDPFSPSGQTIVGETLVDSIRLGTGNLEYFCVSSYG